MHPYFDEKRPHLFAHRGASGERPENTLPAFERAVGLGIRFLEMDCHATSDGEIVLCHDATLERMTDAEGPVNALTFAQLEKVDAGYRFSPDGGRTYPCRGRGVRIPRLSQVLSAFPASRINLEVKQEDPPIAEEVVRMLRKADAESRTLLAAAEDEIMAQIRTLDPGTAIGSSLGDLIAFYRAVADERIETFEPAGHALQIPSHFGDAPLVTPQSVAAARSLGVFIHVWTVNEPAQMRALLEAGADGVMSDFPGVLLAQARALA